VVALKSPLDALERLLRPARTNSSCYRGGCALRRLPLPNYCRGWRGWSAVRNGRNPTDRYAGQCAPAPGLGRARPLV